MAESCDLLTQGFDTTCEQVSTDGRGVKLHQGPLTEEETGFVRACVDVILKVCRLYGFNQKGYNTNSMYRHWERNSFQCLTPLSFAKYKISAYYSAMLSTKDDEQESVPIPKLKVGLDERDFLSVDSPSKIATGKACRWMRLVQMRWVPDVFNAVNALAESFNESILQSKKGMPRPDEKMLLQASIDTFDDLTRERETEPEGTRILLCPLGSCDENAKSIPDVLNWKSLEVVIRRTVKEVFQGTSFSQEDLLKPFIPSSNGHYNYSRSDFGALGRFFDEERNMLVGDLIPNGVQKVRSEVVGRRGRIVAPPKYSVDTLQANYCKMYSRITRMAAFEEPVACLNSFPEALKTRTVTSGPSALYFALKPLQKKMWSVLSAHPCFTLTGQTISAEYIQQRMGKTLGPHHRFASIDYKNATNLIDGRASEIVCDEISKIWNLEPHLVAAFKKSLTGHMLMDPRDESLFAMQENGQLMGSVTSFPVLCLINAAICRWTLELDQGKRVFSRIPLKTAKLCVNGDDAVMPLTANGLKIWERIGRYVGLQKSVGKVYFSKRILNMNSTSFRYRGTPWSVKEVECFEPGRHLILREEFYRQTPYVNMGLMMGKTRSGMTDPKKDGTVGSRARELVRLCPHFLIPIQGKNEVFDLTEKVLGCFIGNNKQKLEAANLPWFIPEEFGGLGLPCVGKYQARELDLRLARKIYERYQLPQRTEIDWPLWKLAQEKVPAIKKELLSSFGEIVTGSGIDTRMVSRVDLIALQCLDILMQSQFVTERINLRQMLKRFRSPKTNQDEKDLLKQEIESLFDKGHIEGEQVYEQRVRRIWRKALTDNKPLPEPFGVKPTPVGGFATEYNFPVKYDDTALPLFELECAVREEFNVYCETMSTGGVKRPASTKVCNPPCTVRCCTH